MMLEGIAIASLRARRAHLLHLRRAASSSTRRSVLETAIDEAYAAGIFGKKLLGKDFELDCYLVRGAGAYICGEETALLESLEGKKGWPRLKPPFPAVVGLFGCPTVVNNVETLATRAADLREGRGVVRQAGHRQVRRHPPGVPLRLGEPPGRLRGVACTPPSRELIYDETYGQGMPAGRKVKAVIPGGSSAPVLAADELDVALEFEALKAKQTMAGSGGVIVMDDATCMVRCLWRVARFYAEESCGQCTPCREGTPVADAAPAQDRRGPRRAGRPRDAACNVASSIAPYPPIGLGNTICALGDAAALPDALLRHASSAHEFEAHIDAEALPVRRQALGPRSEDWSVSDRRAVLFWIFARPDPAGAAAVVIAAQEPHQLGDVRWWRPSSSSPASTCCCWAHTIAVLQVLVYAGAIMVLFLFVIMLLSLGEAELARATAHVLAHRWAASRRWALLRAARRRDAARPPMLSSLDAGTRPTLRHAPARGRGMLYTQWLLPVRGGVAAAAGGHGGRGGRRQAAASRGGPMMPRSPSSYYLFLAAALFCLGMFGVLVRRNALVVFMCVELMLNAANLTFLAFARAARRRPGPRLGLLRHRGGRGRGRHRPGHRHRRVPQPRHRQHRRHQDDEALTRNARPRDELLKRLHPDSRPRRSPAQPRPVAVDDHRAAAAGRVHLRRVRPGSAAPTSHLVACARGGRLLRALGAGVLGASTTTRTALRLRTFGGDAGRATRWARLRHLVHARATSGCTSA